MDTELRLAAPARRPRSGGAAARRRPSPSPDAPAGPLPPGGPAQPLRWPRSRARLLLAQRSRAQTSRSAAAAAAPRRRPERFLWRLPPFLCPRPLERPRCPTFVTLGGGIQQRAGRGPRENGHAGSREGRAQRQPPPQHLPDRPSDQIEVCGPRAGRGRAAGDQGTAAGGPGLAKPKERLRETRSPRGPGGSTRRGRGRLQRGPGQRPAASLRVCLPATARRGGPSPLKCRAAAAEPAGSAAGGPTRAPRATRVRAGRDDCQLGCSHTGRGPRQRTGRTAGLADPYGTSAHLGAGARL